MMQPVFDSSVSSEPPAAVDDAARLLLQASYGGLVDEEEVREHAALVALLRTRPTATSEREIAAQVLEAGSARAVWAATRAQTLLPDAGDDEALLTAATDVAGWNRRGMTVLAITDALYPQRLRNVHEAPPLLFTRGVLHPDDHAVSVVGSRQASDRGRQIAAAIATAVVGEGLTVASGLAVGIDTAAHRAALDAGGRTVAFIATGQERSYPAANAPLQQEIAERGLVLSQFWPDSPPHKHTFLMRNATMSGYGLATIVVEAGEHSGARAQARMAVAHGRSVILTDAVVQANEWARALAGRPGVRVADGLRSVMDEVVGLRERSTRLARALQRLVDA